jgi:hypothetical protein
VKPGFSAQGIVVVRLIAALRLPTEEVRFVRSAVEGFRAPYNTGPHIRREAS